MVNDGEMSKVTYATYVSSRLTGFGRIKRYACTGPVSYIGQDQLESDIDNLGAAVADSPAEEAFMTAASPGIVAWFQPELWS